MKNKFYWLFLIVLIGFILRFYKLGEVPLGFHQDEVSQAYNSYSILTSGRDRYGQILPILFRSFGSYQPPVYTYLTTIPIYFFGNTVFAARFTSALFGILTVIFSYYIAKLLSKDKYAERLGMVTALIVAISPWSIHFSRRVVEGNLGLFFFLLALLLFLSSLKKIRFFIAACLILGISTYAYYSEQLISVIFLPVFLMYFRSYFRKYRKIVIYGLLGFGFILSFHLITVLTGAFFARFNQVGTSADNPFILEFVKHFLGYFSPAYLFSDAGNGLARVSPNLGIFYSWFFIPFLAGIYFLKKNLKKELFNFILICTVVFLVPASLTGDVFYPLRALEFFWILTFIVSVGIIEIGLMIRSRLFGKALFVLLILFSLASFYISYFVLFQHETSENVGNTYIELSRKLEKYGNHNMVLDSTRDPAAGLRIAYFRKYRPDKLQALLGSQLTNSYYNSRVNLQELYVVDNIEIRPIDWKKDRCGERTILVGDSLTFSNNQIKEHNLSKLFEIKGINNNGALYGYETSPDQKCK